MTFNTAQFAQANANAAQRGAGNGAAQNAGGNGQAQSIGGRMRC